MKTDQLVKLDRNDAEKLKALLTECFEEDPLYCQLIPQRELRKKMLPDIFSCDLDDIFENCEVYADSKDVNGVIVVVDESEPYSKLKYYYSSFLYVLKTMRTLIKDDTSLRTLWNFAKGRDYLNSAWTDDIENDKRVHIEYFAVRPSMRGKGIAGKLMRSVLEYADQNELATSLETHNEKNVRIYEHYGFRLFETVQKDFDVKQFCMVR